MDRSPQLQSTPSRQASSGPAAQGLDPSLPEPVQVAVVPAPAPDLFSRIREALEAMRAEGSAVDRYEAGNLVRGLVAQFQRSLTGPALQEVMTDLRDRFIPDLVGVKFKRDTWENDDDTVIELAMVKYGIAYEEEGNPANSWTEWLEDHEIEKEYPNLRRNRDFYVIQDRLAELGGWNVDAQTETFKVLLEEPSTPSSADAK